MTGELVPLRIAFDVAWPGYRRDQVRRYVDEAEADVRLLTADRDAALRRADLLADRLEAQRRENRRLWARLDRVCRTPLDRDGAEERAWHVVRLAHAEADAIVGRARAAAERAWSEVDAVTAEAERRRRELADRAARVREDFELAMSARRAEALAALAAHDTAARQRADRVVARARQRAAELDGHHDRVVARLRAAADVLTRAGAALGPEIGELTWQR
ncbi:M protein [Saccharothrix sp. NPDC042600]|uniref:M protein n=1 Tax=Saccharothrix TaxID=2071 RepID=UPI0033DAFBBF|nr:hypothetical protein GCM10017745_40770 [Saccharothrix mutabilis subsp. capreolus]